ncbi:MAG: HAMP domain-containing histidine kinase [Oscillospiraceae bacterium]|nr:HAMP domain-containing histidine kinase [Oscillospiraceae bacterium]
MKQTKRKTIFKKYLRMTLATIFISFCILGLVMLLFFNSNWKHEKRDGLEKNALSISDIVSRGVAVDSVGSLVMDTDDLQKFLPALSRNNESDIFITGRDGKILVTAQGVDGTLHTNKTISADIMQKALGGRYDDQTMLSGVYDAPCYVVGVPVTVKVSSGKTQSVGAVFTAVAVHSLVEYRKDILWMFLFAALAAFAVSFCMVWVFSYNMVRPLRSMADAAKNFGDGNFNTRVPVTSRDEVGELAVAFNNMADSLASSEYTRRSFIANVSHELKTPMTTIAGFIDGILDGTIPPEKEEHYLHIVSQEVKRLSRLVKTMLDLSRIDSGELRLRPARFDLTETVLTTMLSFEDPIEKKKIAVHGLEDTHPIFVDGDPDMIHQVIYNLVENAVKFTNESGTIEVRLREEPQRTEVTIRNSGDGIAPDELARIFDRFYKTDKSRSKDKTGMGLGLYIVRTIIQLHGGEITVHSKLGACTEFAFWLPGEIPQTPGNEPMPTTTVCAEVVKPLKQKKNAAKAEPPVLEKPENDASKKA